MRVLVAEDDPDLSRNLTTALKAEGYAVDAALDGEDALFLGESEPYDVIVLDLGLPKVDGAKILNAWRKNALTTPVLILTARDEWTQKVSAFDAGADDYLTKPFHTEELLARLRALLRRASGATTSTLVIGDLQVDTRAAQARVGQTSIRLTAQEFRVLRYLAHRAGDVISRSELTEHVYDQDFDRDSNTIEVFVGRLRKKIGADRIETIRGLGYRLIDPNAPSKQG